MNNMVLTEEGINSALADNQNKGIWRDEYVNRWIENEILYQEAEKEGLLKGKAFVAIIEQSKKQLAASLFINKILADNKFEISEDDLNQYFDSHKEEFKLADDLFHVNLITFNDFEKAVQFRNNAVETDWNRASNSFKSEKSVIVSKTSEYLYRYQVQPLNLIRMIENLQSNEIGIVLETEPAMFTVVQLIEKLDRDSVPSFDVVKNEVYNRLVMIKNKEYVKQYIDKLISSHNLEIERYSE